MGTFDSKYLTFFLAGLAMMFLGAVTAPALAGPNGTTSGETTANALPTGDTFPQSTGEMSVKWNNTTGGDTQFADSAPGNVTTTVDTGFDMSNLQDPGNQTITPGDSTVYTLDVQNKGNNAEPVTFNFEQTVDSGVQSSFTWELFEEDSGNNSFDTGVDRRLENNGGTIAYAENEQDTLYAVVTATSDAGDGDTLGHRFFATNNAPINGPGSNVDGTPGDQWERGTVIGTEDTYDTQTTFYRTSISGPVMTITKSIDDGLSSGSYRPGDTVGYRITATNTGSDTATDVEVVDAMPDSTTLSTIGTGSTLNGNTLSATEQDNDVNQPFEDDAGSNENTERIKWTIDEIGPSGQSNDSVELTFRVRID